MKILTTPAIAIVAMASVMQVNVATAEDVALETNKSKFSYAVGISLARQLGNLGLGSQDIDTEALVAGVTDAVSGSDFRLSGEELRTAVAARQQEMESKAKEEAVAKTAEGDAFREANAAKDGVTETSSGLQYSVLNSGDSGGDMPGADSTVLVHYRGTLIDGREFDSSYSRGEPAKFSLTGIIPGWSEALQLMRPGDKWSIVIPPELAYGDRGAGPRIGPGETLIFEIELIEIK